MACIAIPNITDITAIVPTINDLLPSFTLPFSIPQIALSNLGLSVYDLIPPIPTLPSMPSPITAAMPTLVMPQTESLLAAGGILQGQIYQLINEFIGKITAIIPAIALPEMPGLPGVTLPDLLVPDPAALLAMINVPGFDFSGIPNLPTLWPTIVIPELLPLMALQFASQGFVAALTTSCLTLLSSLLSFLHSSHISFPAAPTFPTMPTLADIEALLPPFPTWEDLQLTIPGFPAFALPSPLVPSMSIPEVDFGIVMNYLQANCSTYLWQLLSDYALSLPLLGSTLAFPTISVWLGSLPTIPPICDPSITVPYP